MWTTIYTIDFKDIAGAAWHVAVQADEDSTPAPVALQAAGDPLTWNNGGKGDIGECVLGGTGYLRIAVQPETEGELEPGKLLPQTATDRRVVVTRGETVVWQGFIQPQTFDQDWVAAPYEIELPLMDTVEVLKHVYIGDNEGAESTIELMFSAYQKAGGELPITDFIRTNRPQYRDRDGAPTSMAWSEAKFSPSYFSAKDEDDHRFSYSEVLGILLSPHGLIWATGERWFVGAASTEATQLYKWRQTVSPDEFPWIVAEVVPETDITDKIGSTDNKQTLLPPPARITLNYSPESGNEDFSGDTITNLTAEYIHTPYAFGMYQDNHIDEEQITLQVLRYLKIKSSNMHVPFVKTRHLWTTTYRDIFNPVSHTNAWTVNPNYSFTEITSQEQGWAQCLDIKMTGLVETRNPLCLLHERGIDVYRQPISSTQAQIDAVLRQTVDTIRFRDELFTTNVFCLELTTQMMHSDQLSDAAVAPGEGHGVVPMVQIYWSDTYGGAPKKYLRWEWYTDGTRTVASWEDCDGFFVPASTDRDARSNLPHSAMDLRSFKDGGQFGLPNGRGFVSLRIYSGGWIYDSDNDLLNHTIPDINGYMVLTDFNLRYTEINTDAIHLAEWNTETRDNIKHQYASGVEDVTLDFKTNANIEPTAATFCAPERGFDDSIGSVNRMREMIDIAAVRFSDTAPGAAQMSLYQFDGQTYFPAGFGMNAKNNELKLKLIRTI